MLSHPLRPVVAALLLVLLTAGLAVGTPAVATAADEPPDEETSTVDPYAAYEPQKRCSPRAKKGATMFRAWTVDGFGGAPGGISRACGGSVSEHKEGRAVDWTVNAKKRADRLRVRKFITTLFETGPTGETHELARRMGVMYVIWDDRIWSSYDGFERRKYVSSSCRGKRLKRCSATLRHRDHVHVSLSRKGGAAKTSWYASDAARAYR